jgi:hypothetical protein
MSKRPRERSEFSPQFESRETLDALLAASGGEVDTEGAVAAMREAVQQHLERNEVIRTLFQGEPRPPSPEVARRLFENLLGLWELVQQGKPIPLGSPSRPGKQAAKPSPSPPARFGDGGPDEAFVEAAWRYLESAPERERNRLLDAFENRQDPLVGYLDEPGLSDEGYATARHLLFELFAMLELGTQYGTHRVRLDEVEAGSASSQDAPPSLVAYVDEALFEAQQDEEQPLSREEASRVRERVIPGLVALWRARRSQPG